MKKSLTYLILLTGLILILSGCKSGNIQWSTDQLVITVNNKGYITSLTNPVSSKQFVPDKSESPIIQFRKDSVYYQPDKISQGDEADIYTIDFADSDIRASIRVTSKPSHIVFELVNIDQAADIDLIVWGPYQTSISQTIGEIVGVVRDSSFAIGIQALNIRTLGGCPEREDDVDPNYNIFETNSVVDVSDSIKVFYRPDHIISNKFVKLLIISYNRWHSTSSIVIDLDLPAIRCDIWTHQGDTDIQSRNV